MACPIKDTCAFFNNQIRMSEERKKMIKTNFCLSGYSQCARFKVYTQYKSTHKVPVDLYPNNFERAHELIIKDRQHGSL